VTYNFVGEADMDDDDEEDMDEHAGKHGGFKGGNGGGGEFNENMVSNSSSSETHRPSRALFLASECAMVKRGIVASSWAVLFATAFFWFWSLKQVISLGWFNDGFDGCLLVALVLVALPHLAALSSVTSVSKILKTLDQPSDDASSFVDGVPKNQKRSTATFRPVVGRVVSGSVLEVAAARARWFRNWVLPGHLLVSATFIAATVLLLITEVGSIKHGG
jgi:hypothetical protein